MTATQTLRQFLKALRTAPGFDRHLQNVNVISASVGKVHCELLVQEEHLNMKGTLHGGFTATIVDTITTCALATCDRPALGVSVDLNVSYVDSAKPGDTLSIKAEVLKRGNRLGYTTVSIQNQHGVLLASGRHTKYLND